MRFLSRLERMGLATVVLAAAFSLTHSAAPNPGLVIDSSTAQVSTDPQNDFLSPNGATWGVGGESVTENETVEGIERLLKAAKRQGIPVFVSPHDHDPTHHCWKFEGALEALMHDIGVFDREGARGLDGFEGSGDDRGACTVFENRSSPPSRPR